MVIVRLGLHRQLSVHLTSNLCLSCVYMGQMYHLGNVRNSLYLSFVLSQPEIKPCVVQSLIPIDMHSALEKTMLVHIVGTQ